MVAQCHLQLQITKTTSNSLGPSQQYVGVAVLAMVGILSERRNSVSAARISIRCFLVWKLGLNSGRGRID